MVCGDRNRPIWDERIGALARSGFCWSWLCLQECIGASQGTLRLGSHILSRGRTGALAGTMGHPGHVMESLRWHNLLRGWPLAVRSPLPAASQLPVLRPFGLSRYHTGHTVTTAPTYFWQRLSVAKQLIALVLAARALCYPAQKIFSRLWGERK